MKCWPSGHKYSLPQSNEVGQSLHVTGKTAKAHDYEVTWEHPGQRLQGQVWTPRSDRDKDASLPSCAEKPNSSFPVLPVLHRLAGDPPAPMQGRSRPAVSLPWPFSSFLWRDHARQLQSVTTAPHTYMSRRPASPPAKGPYGYASPCSPRLVNWVTSAPPVQGCWGI